MRRAALLCLLTQGAAASDALTHAAAAASNALTRVDVVLAWLAGNATAPAHWPIRSRDDVKSKNWKHLGGGNVKDVYETKIDGKRVVVKTRLTSAAHQDRVEADARGELLYLEYLRDLPGVPREAAPWTHVRRRGRKQVSLGRPLRAPGPRRKGSRLSCRH